jgi:hypothetical protein
MMLRRLPERDGSTHLAFNPLRFTGLRICVHECRVTKADECYLATLRTSRNLRLLDLCGDVENDGSTPFQSLYLAVQFLFGAEQHAYDITQPLRLQQKKWDWTE